ncbi:MAG: class I SAM-dependent methyltransferase [Bacillota bacterium]
MSHRVEIFNRMLKVFADLAYPFEREFFKNEAWKRAKHVMDLGCGNCSYTSLLASDFPDKKFTCVDPDMYMINTARQLFSLENMDLVCGHLDNLEVNHKYDFIIIRLAVRHMGNREGLLRKVRSFLASGASIMVIDADVENIVLGEELTGFMKVFQNMYESSGNTSLNGLERRLIDEFEKAGLRYDGTVRVSIDSGMPKMKKHIYEYMKLVSQMAYYPFIPEGILRELDEWFINSVKDARIGTFASIYSI